MVGRRSACLIVLLGATLSNVTAIRADEPAGVAASSDEEDDPAFARRKAAAIPAAPAPVEAGKPASAPETSAPEPSAASAPSDDDEEPVPSLAPGHIVGASVGERGASATTIASTGGTTGDASAHADAHARRWIPDGEERRGLRVRVAYRMLQIPEVKDVEQHLGDDDFHAIGFEVYPFSGVLRIGLSTQLAIESGGDFVASEGLTLGLTRPGATFAPFIEGGVHAGLGRRSVWIPTDPAPTDFPTLMLLYTGEVGFDARLGRAVVTIAIGLQRSSFYLSLGDPMEPVVVVDDVTTTFKVGIGY